MLSALLRATNFQSPLLRTLVPTVGAAFAIQGAFAIPSIIAQSERFYDLSGSLTYLSCTALSLALPVLRARAATASTLPWPSITASLLGKPLAQGGWWDWRQLALSAAVSVWATRLGTHLFSRITSDNGTDSRFDKIRTSPPSFLVAFFAQATWVSLNLLPIIALNALPPNTFAKLPLLTPFSVLGVALWISGFALEVAADAQKSKWVAEKKAKKHSEDFLTRGLWGKSRHPNYAGEIALWSGVAIAAASVLASGVGQAALGWTGVGGRLGACLLAGASPAFTTFLLTKVSGIPLSEKKYDGKYGKRKDYQEWKKNTPMLIPKIW
ncbi:putative membrane protein [Microthyrium microscopicum]|uniref:Putative membrane protein n=1 Tax=Microthyrium microscopicum TaxID=703497 RepID=A0A6A6UUM8_9PEZI|nr:putative membrane protein [Microthyrium microscopicum]